MAHITGEQEDAAERVVRAALPAKSAETAPFAEFPEAAKVPVVQALASTAGGFELLNVRELVPGLLVEKVEEYEGWVIGGTLG